MGKEQSADTAGGMSSRFLTLCHLQSLSLAQTSYHKLFLSSPVSWGEGRLLLQLNCSTGVSGLSS